MQIKYVLIVKQNIVINGIVVTEYNDLTVVQCVDFETDGNVKGYVEYKRTAKQHRPLMKGLSQEF